ncbi:MAG: 3-hydroxyacyl-CoA dehydrogenase family protein [Terricaulis sp.]
MSDSVGLDTALKIGKQMAEATGVDYKSDPRSAILSWIVEEKGRNGRKAGKGFYEYGADGKPTRIWPELSERIETKVRECPPALKEELTKRFLFRQCIEVARCFEEGVITDRATPMSARSWRGALRLIRAGASRTWICSGVCPRREGSGSACGAVWRPVQAKRIAA